MLLKKGIFLTAILMLVLLVTTISCAQTAPRTTATSPTMQPSTTTQAAMTTTAKPSPTTSASPSPTTTTQTTTAPTTTPQYGGVLKIITPASPVNLGLPSAATGMDDSFSRRYCAESLVGFDNKGKLIPVPLLATGWQISPNYKTVMLTLRQGVKFHDGTDFNAAAAKFNLDMYIQAKSASPLMKSMTSVDIVDDYTIRLNLSTYQPTILTGVQGPGQSLIFSPTALKTMGDQCLTYPVGTGPFKFVSYTRDVSLEFARFDSYWQKGKPYLNGIKWLFIVDPMTSLAAFKAGDGDVLREVTAKDASALKATGKYNISMVPKTVEGLISDGAHAGSPFSDIRVRRAISYAIDNDALVKMLSYGFNSPANQLAPPSGPFYNPAVDTLGYQSPAVLSMATSQKWYS